MGRALTRRAHPPNELYPHTIPCSHRHRYLSAPPRPHLHRYKVYTDEVQDFTQAELRLFIEVRHVEPLLLGSRGP